MNKRIPSPEYRAARDLLAHIDAQTAHIDSLMADVAKLRSFIREYANADMAVWYHEAERVLSETAP